MLALTLAPPTMRLPFITSTVFVLLASLLLEYGLGSTGANLFDILNAVNTNPTAWGLRSNPSSEDSSKTDGMLLILSLFPRLS